jgi:chorismate lyase/3-hydroxybenzoate synthase
VQSYVDETERARLAPEQLSNTLAVVRFGARQESQRSVAWLEAEVPNAPLSPGPTEEVWSAGGSVSRVDFEGGTAAADDQRLFVAIEAEAAHGPGIEAAALDVYGILLRGLERAGYPHALRIWNYVPSIHETSAGIDRYMRFCKGRSEAFAAYYGQGFPERLPAASAVGCPGRRLVVHALASREAGRHVENPRQVAAYRYPERYGPKSPSFARGTVTSKGRIFVSGTSSIVGHESVFPGDPTRQTEETMRNIAAVIAAAGGGRLSSLRVYVRFPEQLETIRSAILDSTGTPVPTAWLQAQVCREELLVEIEATAQGVPDLRPGTLARKD